MSSHVSKIRSNGGGQTHNRHKKKPYMDERLDIQNIRTEIRELAGSTMEGKNKNQWKKQKLTALGAVDDKGVKTPYHIYMGMQRKQKHRDEIRNRRSQEAFGFDVAKSMKKKKEIEGQQKDFLNQLRGNRRGDRKTVGDGSFGFKNSLGRTKGALVLLSNKDRSTVEGPRNPRPIQGGVKKTGSGFNRKGGYGQKSKNKMRKPKH